MLLQSKINCAKLFRVRSVELLCHEISAGFQLTPDKVKNAKNIISLFLFSNYRIIKMTNIYGHLG